MTSVAVVNGFSCFCFTHFDCYSVISYYLDDDALVGSNVVYVDTIVATQCM